MLYRDIIKELAAENGLELQDLAERAGVKPNTLYQRLKMSGNPRVREISQLLSELGYELAFVPAGEVGRNAHFRRCYVPEFPEFPEA